MWKINLHSLSDQIPCIHLHTEMLACRAFLVGEPELGLSWLDALHLPASLNSQKIYDFIAVWSIESDSS